MIDEHPVVSHHTTLYGVAIGIILALIGLVWGINNNRINKLEEWHQQFEAHAEIPLTKQILQSQSDEITRLEAEVNKLRDEVAKLKNASTYK